jgi:hypothetical protein
MSLRNVLISVDIEQWSAMPSGRRSEILREFMKNYNMVQNANINDINIDILKEQVTDLRNTKVKIDTELQSKEAMLEKALKLIEEQHLKQLESIKKKAEEENKCINCHKPFAAKEHRNKFNKGMICNSCFHTYGSQKFKEWSMEDL